MSEASPRRIEEYLTVGGRSPFGDWLGRLRDPRARARVRVRLDRVSLGNLGDWRPLGGGIGELRLDYGPGYRVYFGEIGDTVILLLCGGTKGTQQKDVDKAREFWSDHGRRAP